MDGKQHFSNTWSVRHRPRTLLGRERGGQGGVGGGGALGGWPSVSQCCLFYDGLFRCGIWNRVGIWGNVASFVTSVRKRSQTIKFTPFFFFFFFFFFGGGGGGGGACVRACALNLQPTNQKMKPTNYARHLSRFRIFLSFFLGGGGGGGAGGPPSTHNLITRPPSNPHTTPSVPPPLSSPQVRTVFRSVSQMAANYLVTTHFRRPLALKGL